MITIEPLLTVDEVSSMIGINKFTLYKKIKENKFPKGIKFNGKRKWKPDEIKLYFNQLGLNVEISGMKNK